MSVFSNNLLLGAGGQSTGPDPFDPTLIGNSIWIDGTADYLSRTPSAGTTTRWIWSSWVQRTEFGNAANAHTIFSAGSSTSNLSWIRFDDQDHFDFAVYQGSTTARKTSSAKYRDIGWYHLCVSFDSGSGVTASDRIKLFVNGIEVTDLSANTDTPSGETTAFNGNVVHEIGRYSFNGSQYGHAYLTQFTMLENKSFQNGDLSITDLLDSFTFGTNGSQFVPKSDADIAALASTAGGNSFCLDFANSSDLGNDISSNNNDFATDGTGSTIAAANQSTSTPSLTFSTYNILDANAAFTSTNDGANTYVVTNVGGAGMRASLPITSGKWYWEQRNGGSNECGPAISAGAGFVNLATNSIIGEGSGSHSVYLNYLGLVRINASTGSSIGVTNGATAVMGVAFDADTGKVWFRDSSGFGTSGDPANGTGEHATLATTSAPFFIAARVGGAVAEPFLNAGGNPTFNGNETAGGNADANGRGNFKLGAVPTGFLSLNTANLSAPTYQGIDYFTPTLYRGNGTGQRVGDFVPFTDSTTIANSIIFNDDDTAYLNRTFVTPTSANKFTFAFWMKCGSSTSDQYIFSTGTTNGTEAYMALNHSTGGGQLWIADPNDGVGWGVKTDRKILDSSSWTHICLSVDTTASSSSRFAIEINGVTATTTAFGAAEPSASQSLNFMTATAKNIGRRIRTSSAYFDGYLSDVYFIDGEKLAASNFAQLDTSTNRWVPKAYSGSYGNNGFKLAFGTAPGTGSGAGTDTSGEGHNWTENNFGTNDQVTDTPTNNVFTFATDGTGTISEGNTRVDLNDSVYGLRPTVANFSSTGKFYGEFLVNAVSGNTVGIGFARDIASQDTTNPSTTPNNDSKNFLLQLSDGNKINGDSTGVSYGSGISAGQTVMWAFDAATRKIWFGSEGTFFASGNPAAGTNEAFILPNTGTVTLVAYDGSNARTANLTMRNATAAFEHTAPTGFTPFTQDNLDDTASKITALAWIKNRDAADDNIWMDRVIGTGGYLSTTQNDSGTAATAYGDGGSDVLTTNANVVQRFLQRGVQIGSDENVNTANESYVLWQWLLGDSATTGSSITTGSPSLATTGIVSDANHFSIVQYTGNGTDNATFAHGLGSTPNFVMIKRISGAALNTDWLIHVQDVGFVAENYIYPHYRIAMSDGVGVVPDANLVELGTGVAINNSGQTHMAYSFKNTPGLCKIGKYTGNSSANGSYISTGFRPSWLWIFNTTLTSADAERPIIDTARYRFNGTTTAGGINGGINFSDQRAAEEAQSTSLGVNPAIDILSDGFKLRANDSTINTGTTYMYICMADIGGNGTLPPVYGR